MDHCTKKKSVGPSAHNPVAPPCLQDHFSESRGAYHGLSVAHDQDQTVSTPDSDSSLVEESIFGRNEKWAHTEVFLWRDVGCWVSYLILVFQFANENTSCVHGVMVQIWETCMFRTQGFV